MRNTPRYRSLLWPAILILAGIVALLVNTGRLPVDRLYQLVNLWPVVLVVIGLELIIRRTVHGLAGDVAAALIVLIAVVGAAAYVTVGPNPSATHTFDAATPAGDLTGATLEIDAGASTVTLSGSTGVGADLEQPDVVVVGRRRSLQEGGAGGALRRHGHGREAQHLGVEGHAAGDITHVEHGMVQAGYGHGRLLP